MSPRVVLVDIDGTVCEDVPNEQSHRFPTALPLVGAAQRMWEIHNQGDEITYFTARLPSHCDVTKEWLRVHGFPRYEHVLCGKPRSLGREYVWIDNTPVTAQHFEGVWRYTRSWSPSVE